MTRDNPEETFTIYIRVSQSDNTLMSALNEQHFAAKAYGEAEGWKYLGENYADVGDVGSKRPALEAMLAHACCDSKPFNVIVVERLDRLFHSEIDLIKFEQRLHEHGVSLHYVTEADSLCGADSTKDAGK